MTAARPGAVPDGNRRVPEKGDGMNRQKALKVLNPVMFLVFLSVSAGGVAKLLDAVEYVTFKWVHPVLGLTLVVLGVLHFILNWPWVRQQFGRKRK